MTGCNMIDMESSLVPGWALFAMNATDSCIMHF